MTFHKLSEYFQKLEATASRNSMVEILAVLFKEASASEIDKVVYLTQGRVAPLYEPVEFQMGEKLVIKAISLATGESLETVTKNFKQIGDLGETIQKLKVKKLRKRKFSAQSAQSQNFNSKLKIDEAFGKLLEITEASGEGSVEKKVDLLTALLSQSDNLSAKYIVRIVLDKLRLGFSDMTVLEGLSWMIDGTKKHKDKIEAAYNVRPDLGFTAGVIRGIGGMGELEKIKPKVGTPILGMRAERLTNTQEIIDKGQGRMAIELKLDGLRTQLHYQAGPAARHPKATRPLRTPPAGGASAYPHSFGARLASPASVCEYEVRLFSRGLEDVTLMYPDIVAAAGKELKGVDEVILDGEVIGFDPKTGKYLPFQETVQRKRKYDIDMYSQNVPVKLVVFDVLFLNGTNLINWTYLKRREALEKILTSGGLTLAGQGCTLSVAPMEEVETAGRLEEIFGEAVKQGLEGIMAKKLDGVYQAGARGWNWIKYKKSYLPAGRQGENKLADTIDAVVMGLDFGQGKRNKFGVGAFLIGVYDQKSDSYKTVSKVGTGLTDEEWQELAVRSKQLAVREKPKNYDTNKIMDCDVWIAPKIVGEFRADNITKSPMHTAGFALRFPRLEKWREKKPEDTTSLKEIEEMATFLQPRRHYQPFGGKYKKDHS